MKKFICIIGIIVGYAITIFGFIIFINNHSKFYAYADIWYTADNSFNIAVVCTIILTVIGFAMLLISSYKLADLLKKIDK